MKTPAEFLKDFSVNIERKRNEYQNQVEEILSKDDISNVQLMKAMTLQIVITDLSEILANKKGSEQPLP